MTASLLALLALATAAHPAESRLQQLRYDPGAVIALHGCTGFQSTVAFAPGERIENIALGDAAVWQATPNKRADLLFLKPQAQAAHTNMTVITDRRRYAFELIARPGGACAKGQGLYELRFLYPDEPPPVLAAAPAEAPPPAPAESALPAPGARNSAYSFTGAALNVPSRAFDDGRSTYLSWAVGVDAPAIYRVAPDKTESLVNYTVKGDFVVVDGVAPAFVLRRGPSVAVLYNDAYQTPALDAAAPQPRPAAPARKPSFLARLFGARETPAPPPPPPRPQALQAQALSQETAR